MDPLVAFCTAVGSTLAFLVAVVVTGVRGKITLHVPCVAATLVSLAVAIVFVLQLGKHYDFSAVGVIYPIHMTLAKVATVSYVLPIITGVRTLKSRAHRRLHFRAAMLVLVLTAVASITGTLMLCLAPKLAG